MRRISRPYGFAIHSFCLRASQLVKPSCGPCFESLHGSNLSAYAPHITMGNTSFFGGFESYHQKMDFMHFELAQDTCKVPSAIFSSYLLR